MISTFISASVLILAVLLIRRLFRGKVDNKLLYALWLVVVVRLILPVPLFFLEEVVKIDMPEISSPVSVLNMSEGLVSLLENGVFMPSGEISGKKAAADSKSNMVDGKNAGSVQSENAGASAIQKKNEANDYIITDSHENKPNLHGENDLEDGKPKAAGVFIFNHSFFVRLIKYIWLTGCVILLCVQIIFEKHFRRTMIENREEVTVFGQKVYKAEKIHTPLLFRSRGFTTDIYIPAQIMEEQTIVFHAMLHERVHRKHGDIWWGYVRNVLVAVYWFHPLVWVAAFASKRDCEYACDSSVMEQMSAQERISYGNSLLSLVQISTGNYLFCTATAMRMGKSEMEERIHMVKKGIKKSVLATVLTAMIILVTGISVFTTAKTKEISDGETNLQPEDEENQEMTMAVLMDCYDKDEFSGWTMEKVSSYTNIKEQSSEYSDVVCIDYVGKMSYQGGEYEVVICFDQESGALNDVMLENKETSESRIIYSHEETFAKYAISPEEFLHHDKILDEHISYTLPEEFLTTNDSYNLQNVGRLFYRDAKKGGGLYGIWNTCLWSCDGGLMETNRVVYDEGADTVRMSLVDYLGNGRYAAPEDAVKEFKGGRLQNVSGCENITSIQGLNFTKDIIENTLYWFDGKEKGELTQREMREALFDRKLWIVSVLSGKDGDQDDSVGYVFFFDAENYTKEQMLALAKSIHIK